MKKFEELQMSCEEIDKENTELRLASQDAAIDLTECEGMIAT